MASSPDCVWRIANRGRSDYIGLTADRRFGMRVPVEILRQVTNWCEQASACETGGLLIGRYTEDHTFAEVTEALPAPVDSKSGPTWLVRGIKGLNAKLRRRWKAGREYYLGEWHYHPAGVAAPSGTDIAQMRLIAASGRYACPEPVLLIVGGTPGAFEMRCFVFPADHECINFVRR